MATVVLQVAGAAIGAALGGPVGAIAGRALGAIAGYGIDRQLFSKDQVVRGGRLDETRLLTSDEGAPIPRSYGWTRLGGQIIWATRFREVVNKKKKKSGKGGGGPSVTTVTYSYFANFAIGICEGEISKIGRIWADGTELDRSKHAIRIYRGTEDQQPDSLIEAKQGFGKAPAFRGTAYAVFEDLAIADFGNRIPQITFEVIRGIASVDSAIRSINIIPGSSEFGYSPTAIRTNLLGRNRLENANQLVASSDWTESLDQLQALCPNLTSVSLVAAWFGDDLRAGECRIEPRVEGKETNRHAWTVSGISRAAATLTSRIEGRPAYGGTPDDAAVIAAIQDIRARGLKVGFYPFILMDVPQGNGLADPYGGTEQAAYPWRGRITCHPAPGEPGSPDQSAAAAAEVAAFLGNAQIHQFTPAAATVTFSGGSDFGLRRMVLHYAHLCVLAGGVDTFLVGSELPGLTKLRDGAGAFPFVAGLQTLAADVRSVLGAGAAISYAADWSEYFGYHPSGPDGDVLFNLDPLWADANIDFIGIDNYMPASDWQETGDPGMPDRHAIHDPAYLEANLLGGEGHDWFYASDADRANGIRTAITDGLGEPWIWAYKNLPDWWSNAHHERLGGMRSPVPTAWVPQSKPLRFTELGCAAIDRSTNQPNVFVDAKSSQSALPWFSRAGRDDLLPLRYAAAQLSFWDASHPLADSSNPVSSVYGERMIDVGDLSFWAWDARPFPAFPSALDVWSDGLNWYRGHWLNGRLGTCPLDDLLAAIFADIGMAVPELHVDGHVTGYVIGGNGNLRQTVEPLLTAFNLAVHESGGKLVLTSRNRLAGHDLVADELALQPDAPLIARRRAGEHELPRSIVTAHADLEARYDTVTTAAARSRTASNRELRIDLPAVLPRETAQALTISRLRDFWTGRDTMAFGLPLRRLEVEPGDLLSLEGRELSRVASLTLGRRIDLETAAISRHEQTAVWGHKTTPPAPAGTAPGVPQVLLMNLPLAQNEADPAPRLHAAVYADPWSGTYAILRSPGSTGFETVTSAGAPATLFEVLDAVGTGPLGRWDHAAILHVRVLEGEFESLEDMLVFEGRNAVAVATAGGGHEIVQFRQADLIAADEWRLTGLLRGQLGTDGEMVSGIEAGALGVLIDEAVTEVPVPAGLVGLSQNYRVLAQGEQLGSANAVALAATCTAISARPLSPVHLVAARTGSGYAITWLRRSRLDSDRWDIEEVPLDHSPERYRVSILDGAALVREWDVTAPAATYPDSERLADFASPGDPFAIAIAQLAENGTPGPAATLAVQP
ncbi:MAG: glycoside hydrolase TIM-barrel-like domain-containing protein [Nitratireductor sp.]|nr:glycoside hydrolase TIM-barrel-like domain-containing protein [Nitratireductor sp.]